MLWESSRNPQEPKKRRKPLNHKRLTSLFWMICLIGTVCWSWTIRGDAGVMQYGQSFSTAIGPSLRRVGVQNSSCFSVRVGLVSGRGDPIEQIKALMAPFTDWDVWSCSPFCLAPTRRRLKMARSVKGVKWRRALTNLVWEETGLALQGNVHGCLAGWSRCRFWFWRLYRVQI